MKAQLQVDILTSIFSLKVLQLNSADCVSRIVCLSFFVTVYICVGISLCTVYMELGTCRPAWALFSLQ